jgi:hypothetical protein
MRRVGWVITFPYYGGLLRPVWKMTVEAVVAGIELAADKPSGITLGKVRLGDGMPLLAPRQKLGRLSGPEFIRLCDGCLINARLVLTVDDGVFSDVGRHLVYFLFRHKVLLLLDRCST